MQQNRSLSSKSAFHSLCKYISTESSFNDSISEQPHSFFSPNHDVSILQLIKNSNSKTFQHFYMLLWWEKGNWNSREIKLKNYFGKYKRFKFKFELEVLAGKMFVKSWNLKKKIIFSKFWWFSKILKIIKILKKIQISIFF